jgi:hemoglobin-like flavoprotein
VDLSTVLSEQSLGAGTFNINRESLAYMTPERFFGRPHTQATDQFSLGLIATELIGGEQIPRVNSPSDLELKRQVFRDLETGKGRWAGRSPELAGIVARMLRTHPDGRWPSMTDVRHFLRDVDIAESEEDRNRSIAKAIYLRLQTGEGGSEFFARFYKNLFERCPDVEAHFKATDMQRQHMMLNRAIQLLLDFNSARGSEQLRDLGASHGALGLSGRHYELFLEILVTTIEQSGTSDAEQLTAWRDTLARGVEFMRICQGESAAKHARSAGA